MLETDLELMIPQMKNKHSATPQFRSSGYGDGKIMKDRCEDLNCRHLL